MAVLVERSRERPNWSPATLKEISDATIRSNFFSDDSPYLSSAPTLTIPDHVTPNKDRNPMRYCLPTEKEIGSMVRGSHPASGKSGLTLPELMSKFEDLRKGKHGVREKVLEVVQRKCDIVDNADGNFQWLKWKH
jgi:3-hydroxyisobutyryl-CoA hydrolase